MVTTDPIAIGPDEALVDLDRPRHVQTGSGLCLSAGPQPGWVGFDAQSFSRRAIQSTIEVLRLVDAEPDPLSVYRQVRQLAMSARTSLMAARVEQYPHTRPACARGCAYCCHLRVSTNIPEVLCLAGRIAKMPRAVRRDITRRCQLFAPRGRGLDANAYSDLHQRCAMLKGSATAGSCLVYQDRPLTCAIYEMPDVGTCIETWKDPNAKSVVYTSPRMEVMSMFGATSLAYSIRFGGPAEVELHSALVVALTVPDAAAQWMAGRPVFESARINSVATEAEFIEALSSVMQSNGLGHLAHAMEAR